MTSITIFLGYMTKYTILCLCLVTAFALSSFIILWRGPQYSDFADALLCIRVAFGTGLFCATLKTALTYEFG